MIIDITVNGEIHHILQGNLLDLIHHFNLKKEWTIAELNDEAVSRDDYDKRILKSGDVVELVRAVAGG